MSTHSFIAKQVAPDKYRGIYCHHDGYLTHNGAVLVDHYSSPEKVDKLLDLGDISDLGEKVDPDPSRPHGFDYGKQQPDVTVAYGRDRGEKGTQAILLTTKQLEQVSETHAYPSRKQAVVRIVYENSAVTDADTAEKTALAARGILWGLQTLDQRVKKHHHDLDTLTAHAGQILSEIRR